MKKEKPSFDAMTDNIKFRVSKQKKIQLVSEQQLCVQCLMES